ncbi:MAG: CoA ester lyase [Pseudomonadota bacterium]
MDVASRPWRSVLYIPAARARVLDKARSLPVDALIFDLEDAVAPDDKVAARATMAEALGSGGYGDRAALVRINATDTPWGAEDLEAAAAANPDAILIPKVDTPEDVALVARRLDALGSSAAIWAMMETPAGCLNAAAVAHAPRMAGFVIGTNDLAKDIGCATGGDRMAMMTALQMCVLGARAAGIRCVDGVYNAFKDQDGLRSECAQGKELGMDGKSLIHPDQIAIANAVFTPAEDEVDLARRQIDAYEAALAAGQGVAVLDGKIVENLHVASARALLARVEAIAARKDT